MAIHVIGLGAAEQAVLTANAMQALDNSQVIIGSPRQLETVSIYLNSDSEFVAQPRLIELPKLNELKELLTELSTHQASDLQISILASGDPLYFGIGRWLSKQSDISELSIFSELCFYPGISSIQAACHKLGLSMQDCDAISLHGRPVETLRSLIRHNQTLVILTDKHSQPKRLAQECSDMGYQNAKITVCEDLGYEKEQVRSFSIETLLTDSPAEPNLNFSDLQVTVIETGISQLMPQFPGFNDELFITGKEAGKGLITKREVRLAVLSLLQPSRGDVAWDVGAGCGGIAVEWAYWNKQGQVLAIEHNDQRFDCLQQNSQRFGVVDNLKPIQGRAPAVLDTLPQANKIFIGGSDGEMSELLAFCWMQLPEQGVLVVSAVMETTKQQLLTFRDELLMVGNAVIETSQVAISRGEELAGQLVYRPNLPVTLFRFQKAAPKYEFGKE